MRSWQLSDPSGPRALVLAATPDPSPGAHDVVVRTAAIALNYRDHLVIHGQYARSLPPRMVPCSDAAGVAIAVGAGVTTVRVGDCVTSTFAPGWQSGPLSLAAARSALGAGQNIGVLADTFVLPEHGIMPMPAGWSFEEASTLPCAALTAWHALFEEGTIAAGSTVLTLGTGGVSIFAAQFALAAGARVIATSSRDDKLDRLTALGVQQVVNYRRVPTWGEHVRSLADGIGVDRVIEVGGQGTLEQSIKAVRPGGTIALIGSLAGPSPVNLTPVFMRNIRLQGIMVGSREMFVRMNQSLDATGVRPIVDRVFPFEEAPEALAYLAAGSHFGKVIVRV